MQTNVALCMASGVTGDEFIVYSRGLMHLGILLENMRREGYEICVGKPQVIIKEMDGLHQEPIKRLVIECPAHVQNAVMSLVAHRRSELVKMDTKTGTSDLCPHGVSTACARSLWLECALLTASQGRAVMHPAFERYAPMRGAIPGRQAGVMIATDSGAVTPYALDALYNCGIYFRSIPGYRV